MDVEHFFVLRSSFPNTPFFLLFLISSLSLSDIYLRESPVVAISRLHGYRMTQNILQWGKAAVVKETLALQKGTQTLVAINETYLFNVNDGIYWYSIGTVVKSSSTSQEDWGWSREYQISPPTRLLKQYAAFHRTVYASASWKASSLFLELGTIIDCLCNCSHPGKGEIRRWCVCRIKVDAKTPENGGLRRPSESITLSLD